VVEKMLNDIPFPMLVLGGGVVLAALFFGAWWVRSRKRRSPSVKSSAPVVPLFGQKQAISERVTTAKRATEIIAEEVLDAQDEFISLKARQATVDAVLQATEAVAVKNG
jgi:uncharacterized membrane protein